MNVATCHARSRCHQYQMIQTDMKTKYFIRLAAPVMLGAILLTSCDDDPAVGTPLNPVAEENYGPKAYIYSPSLPANTASTKVIQTPTELILSTDTFDVYVKLTKAVEKDVAVKLTTSEEATAAYGQDADALPSQSVNIINPSVVIKAGQTQSAEPIRVTLNKDDSFRTMSEQGVAVLKLTSDDKEVATSQNYDYYNILVNKEVTNMKSQSQNDLKALKMIDIDQYTVYQDGYETSDISDGYTSTYISSKGPYDIDFVFNEPREFKGLSYQFGYSVYYSPTIIDILTSDDGENWVSQTGGETTNNAKPSKSTDIVPWVFYSGVKCTYVRLRLVDCYYSRYGAAFNYPIVSEVRLYE